MNKHEQELERIKAQIAECDANEQDRIMAIARNFQRQIRADPPAGCLAIAYVATDFSVQAVKHGIVPLAESLPKPEEISFQADRVRLIDSQGNTVVDTDIDEAVNLLRRILNVGWGGNVNEELHRDIRKFVGLHSAK